MILNRNISNDALMADEKIRTALEGGAIILVDKILTANPEYTNMYFRGLVVTESASTVSEAAASLLGWSDKNVFLMAAMQNAKTEIADKHEVGKVFPAFAIQIVDSNRPAYEGHTPRQSKDGDVYLDEAGQPIYRTGRLVTKQELEDQGHKTIKRAQVVRVSASVQTAQLLGAV